MIPRPHNADDSDLLQLDDESLVEKLRCGRQDVFTVLYQRFSQAVFDIARRIIGDDAEAEEIVQLVLLEVYQKILVFDATKGSFRLWVLNTGRRRAIDRLRHLRARHTQEATQFDEYTMPESELRGPMPPFTQQEVEHLLKEMLGALSAKEQQVIELHFMRGLTLDEIRQEMNESLPAVRHLYYGGIDKLRLGLSSRRKGLPDSHKRKGTR